MSKMYPIQGKPKKVPLSPISVTYWMELVHLDYLTIEDKEGRKDINFQW